MMVIGLVAALAGAGLYAYFNDTETAGQNTFTAGTLDLKVWDGDSWEDNPTYNNVAEWYGPTGWVWVSVNFSNVKPGDEFNLHWKLKNMGTLPGNLLIEVTSIMNYENGRNEPEASVDSTSGDLEGELGKRMNHMDMYVHKFELGDPGISRLKDVATGWDPQGADELNDIGGRTYRAANADIGRLDPGEEIIVHLHTKVDPNAGNEIQSDSVQFDIIFHLEQIP
jgi:predicted ribosomally synthesized peptide with SipW-like signal peptide